MALRPAMRPNSAPVTTNSVGSGTDAGGANPEWYVSRANPRPGIRRIVNSNRRTGEISVVETPSPAHNGKPGEIIILSGEEYNKKFG